MKFFRNTEIKKLFSIIFLLSLFFIIFSFLCNHDYGIMTTFFILALDLIFFYYTYKRYQDLNQVVDQINNILSGRQQTKIKNYQEGEISLLTCEVNKLLVKLKNQSDYLLKEKVYLADSIADISHQIRTPLTSINLIISLLQDPDLNEEERRKKLFELKRALAHIDTLITTLLKISKLDAKTVVFSNEKISVKEVIKKSCDPLLIAMELKEQTLHLNIGSECYFGDILWSQEAFMNIIKNCIEHTPVKGNIIVSSEENVIFTEIVIEDDGCGIDEVDLPHLFERFYKGKHSTNNNYGIGLALARMIISNQNGTIKAENKNKGAKFIIRFYKSVL